MFYAAVCVFDVERAPSDVACECGSPTNTKHPNINNKHIHKQAQSDGCLPADFAPIDVAALGASPTNGSGSA